MSILCYVGIQRKLSAENQILVQVGDTKGKGSCFLCVHQPIGGPKMCQEWVIPWVRAVASERMILVFLTFIPRMIVIPGVWSHFHYSCYNYFSVHGLTVVTRRLDTELPCFQRQHDILIAPVYGPNPPLSIPRPASEGLKTLSMVRRKNDSRSHKLNHHYPVMNCGTYSKSLHYLLMPRVQGSGIRECKVLGVKEFPW